MCVRISFSAVVVNFSIRNLGFGFAFPAFAKKYACRGYIMEKWIVYQSCKKNIASNTWRLWEAKLLRSCAVYCAV